MDYLKTVVPSQLVAERGGNLVVINPGSANIRIGLASQDVPFIIPHCIARRTTGANKSPRRNVQDQMLNSQVNTAQHMERERAYDTIASWLKIPKLNDELANSYTRKMAQIDGFNPQDTRKDSTFTWTNVFENSNSSFSVDGYGARHDTLYQSKAHEDTTHTESKYREVICGEEALRISPAEPYCLRRPIRRGHLNVSQYYPTQQVLEDIYAIWEWILIDVLHIPLSQRSTYSAILVVPDTFDSREIKELLTIVLRDMNFSSVVVHQESLAAVFGNGLSTACIVNIGAQVTSITCVEDGVPLSHTGSTLSFGGEDISRCLLWTQRYHQTWPPIRTDALCKPIDLLMLNRLKESYCRIKEGDAEAFVEVHSYDEGAPPGMHKTRLTALNVPPMGLFYPKLLVPDAYPPPPRTWFSDYEDMLEESWHMEMPRRADPSEIFSGFNVGLPMWEAYPVYTNKRRKEDNLGLAEAVTKSILSAGRIDLQRKLFCSIQLVGGVALTSGLIAAVEDRVLHAIPSNEAIDTVEVLQSRTNPAYVAWKGGVILGILDVAREAWIFREDWIQGGLYVGSTRKYRDAYYIQAQTMCYMSS